MIAFAIGILSAMLLLFALITYLWFTRSDPGRHRIPDLSADDTQPYAPVYEGQLLSDFPGFPELGELSERAAPRHERLATTGELRQLAYDGNMDAINAEVAEWRRILDNTDWTTAA